MLPSFRRVVRCSDGHLFETIWMPGGSFKAVRLGRRRLQRCPVGRHWAIVRRVDEKSLTAAELASAHSAHDIRIP